MPYEYSQCGQRKGRRVINMGFSAVSAPLAVNSAIPENLS